MLHLPAIEKIRATADILHLSNVTRLPIQPFKKVSEIISHCIYTFMSYKKKYS